MSHACGERIVLDPFDLEPFQADVDADGSRGLVRDRKEPMAYWLEKAGAGASRARADDGDASLLGTRGKRSLQRAKIVVRIAAHLTEPAATDERGHARLAEETVENANLALKGREKE